MRQAAQKFLGQPIALWVALLIGLHMLIGTAIVLHGHAPMKGVDETSTPEQRLLSGAH